MYRVMGAPSAPVTLDIAAFTELTAPVVPLVRREYAEPGSRASSTPRTWSPIWC